MTRVQGDWWWKDADQQYRLSGTVVVGPVTRWSARSPVGRPGHPLVDLVTHWSAQSPVGRPSHLLVGLVTRWSPWPLKVQCFLATQHRGPRCKAKVE